MASQPAQSQHEMIPHGPPTELTLRSIGQTWDNLSNFIQQLDRLASTLNKGIFVTEGP